MIHLMISFVSQDFDKWGLTCVRTLCVNSDHKIDCRNGSIWMDQYHKEEIYFNFIIYKNTNRRSKNFIRFLNQGILFSTVIPRLAHLSRNFCNAK